MAIVIRQATPEDVPAIVAMGLRFHSATRYGGFFTPDARRLEVLVGLCLQQATVLVAESDVGLVGFLALLVLPHIMSGELYGEEQGWWVEPSARKGRVGLRLLWAAEDWLLTNGVTVLKMGAPAGSRVGAFYALLGLEAVETHYFKRLQHHDVRQPVTAGSDHADAGQSVSGESQRADHGAGPGDGPGRP